MLFFNSKATLCYFLGVMVNKEQNTKMRYLLPLLFITLISNAQTSKTLSGKVMDATSKEPIPFANIQIKGTKTGTQANFDGFFSLKTSQLSDSIVVSMVGYLSQSQHIDSKTSQNFIFQLSSSLTKLNEVKVTAYADPGKALWKKVVARKAYNNFDKFNNYQYEVYNKSEVDLKNVKQENIKKGSMKDMVYSSFQNLDSSNKSVMPLYFYETLSNFYHSKKPPFQIQNLKAKKTIGLETDKFIRQFDKFNEKINIYQNWNILYNNNFVSPISDLGSHYYKYEIMDTTMIDPTHRYFRMKFSPKRKNENTFNGEMWIEDDSYAVQRFDMIVSKDVNLNFIKGVRFFQDFVPVFSDTMKAWMPRKGISEVEIESGPELLGLPFSSKTKQRENLVFSNTTTFDKVRLNEEMRDSSLFKSKYAQADSNYLNKTEQFWKTARLDSLSKREIAIYQAVDSLKDNDRFNRTVKLTTFLASGYWDFAHNTLRVGPYSSFISRNLTEGWRTRFGLWTLEDFNKKINLNGYIAYGFGDKRLKGGLGIKYLHSISPWVKTEFYAHKDYDMVTVNDDELDKDNIFNFAFRKNIPSYQIFVGELKLQHERQLTQDWTLKASVAYKTIDPVFKFVYQNIDGDEIPKPSDILHQIYTSEGSIDFRYAHNERTTILNYDKIHLSTPFPVVHFKYTLGFETTAKTLFNYHKLDVGIIQTFKLPPKGTFYYNLSMGKTFGTLPYILLHVPRGNEAYFLSSYAFNTMNPYEFADDKYTSLLTRYSLGGFIFDKIPLLNKLNWRERVTANVYWGSMSAANKTFNSLNDVRTGTGNKPFAEAGFGIENIFHVFTVDAIWRLNHNDNPAISKFGIFTGLQLKF